jgi:hypothetical protein
MLLIENYLALDLAATLPAALFVSVNSTPTVRGQSAVALPPERRAGSSALQRIESGQEGAGLGLR